MHPPNTTYATPEMSLVPDTHARPYANVDNQVVRYLHQNSDEARTVPVVVPTALFTLMRHGLKVAPEDEVTLYLVPDGEYFVFGMSWGTDDLNVADLWYYTEATLPTFFA